MELIDFLLDLSDDTDIKSASFKCLQSSFVNGANKFTDISPLFTHAQGNLEFKISKISLKLSFDLDEKPFFHRVI